MLKKQRAEHANEEINPIRWLRVTHWRSQVIAAFGLWTSTYAYILYGVPSFRGRQVLSMSRALGATAKGCLGDLFRQKILHPFWMKGLLTNELWHPICFEAIQFDLACHSVSQKPVMLPNLHWKGWFRVNILIIRMTSCHDRSCI